MSVMGLQPACLLSCTHTTSIPFRYTIAVSTPLIFWSFACKMEKRYLALSLQPIVEAFNLIVDEGIHGIKDNTFDAFFPLIHLLKESIEYWKYKALCFTC